MGSALYSHHKNNKLESNGTSITEGIGNGRITKNFDKALIDDAFQTDDIEALNLVYDLIEKQKIVLGGSSGINIAGAIKLAKKMGPGKTIVTILCDHGKRYASKIFNKEFFNLFIGVPSFKTEPSIGLSNPMIISTRVDLPVPEDPMIPIDVPFFILNEILFI